MVGSADADLFANDYVRAVGRFVKGFEVRIGVVVQSEAPSFAAHFDILCSHARLRRSGLDPFSIGGYSITPQLDTGYVSSSVSSLRTLSIGYAFSL